MLFGVIQVKRPKNVFFQYIHSNPILRNLTFLDNNEWAIIRQITMRRKSCKINILTLCKSTLEISRLKGLNSTYFFKLFFLKVNLPALLLGSKYRTIRGVGGGSQPPLNFGWGVEHLSPDFGKIFFRGGWLPLNWSNYIVYVFLST